MRRSRRWRTTGRANAGVGKEGAEDEQVKPERPWGGQGVVGGSGIGRAKERNEWWATSIWWLWTLNRRRLPHLCASRPWRRRRPWASRNHASSCASLSLEKLGQEWVRRWGGRLLKLGIRRREERDRGLRHSSTMMGNLVAGSDLEQAGTRWGKRVKRGERER